MVDIDELMPVEHLLRKIGTMMDFENVYYMVGKYYSEDNGKPLIGSRQLWLR